MTVNHKPPRKIHIVGAGATAQIAALELADRGLAVELSEAADAINGRIRTIDVNGWPVDLGPHWDHGGGDSFKFRWLSGRYKQPDKRRYDEQGIFSDIPGHFHLDEAKCRITILPDGKVFFGNELGDAFARRAEERWNILSRDGKDHSVRELAAGNQLDEIHADYSAQAWAGLNDAGEWSGRGFIEDATPDGGLICKAGMAATMAPVEQEIAAQGISVHAGSRISRITRENGGYRLQDARGREYYADGVLWTPPAVLLKQTAIDPVLPPHIVEGLADIVPVYLNKIIVPLRQDFFERPGMQDIETDTHIRILKPPCIFALARSAGAPFVTLFAGGATAREIEGWDQKQVEAFTDRTMKLVPMFRGYGAFLAAPPMATGHGKFGQAYSALRLGGKAAGGPLAHGGFFIANGDLEPLANSPGTLSAAFRSAVKVAPMIAAYCHSLA